MNASEPSRNRPFDKHAHVEESLAEVRQALLALRFGVINITVQDERVVQIDVTEKKRFRAA